MGAIIETGLDLWSDSGSAEALNSAYSAGNAFDSRDADSLWLSLITSGTAVTSLDVQVEFSHDGGTTYNVLAAVNSVSSGSVDFDDMTLVGPGANGNHGFGPIAIPQGVKFRIKAKQTGGDGTSSLLASGITTKNAP